MTTPLQKRVDLKAGFLCNNNCRFCVIADKRQKGSKSTEELHRDLQKAFDAGAREVVLTGGEVTIRQDIFEIVGYARSLGYDNIQIQTNGRMLCNLPFVIRLIEAGASEFSPALHGSMPQMHDYLTRSTGSFKETIKGIKNLRELKQRIITNTVITKPNYRYLPEISQLLTDLCVDQFQLAFVHPVGNAWTNFESIVPSKSLAAEHIHRSMDIAEESGLPAMVEAYPFCFMLGYERYCSERYIPQTEIREFDEVIDFTIARKEEGKIKADKCKACKYFKMCEGPWKEYPLKRGWAEFVPV